MLESFSKSNFSNLSLTVGDEEISIITKNLGSTYSFH